MSGELALVEQSQAIDVGRWAETLVFAVQLAEKVHDTEFVPTALRGRPEAVAATIMYGAEVGVTPMQALAGIHIVEGRPAPSAELMRAMILRAGHAITIHEMTGTRVRVSGLRRGRPESERVVVEWSLDMARAAGLLGRRNWQNYPRAMLTARATGDLARILFADVVKGLGYVAEDDSVAALDGWAADGQETAQEAPRKRLQRSQRRTAPRVTDEPSTAQNPVSEPAPVAPSSAPATRPNGGVTTGAGVAHRETAPAPADDVPTYDDYEPGGKVHERRHREAEQVRDVEPVEPEETEPLSTLPPEVVGDALAEVRATIYDTDRPMPELAPENPAPEPPAPTAPTPVIGVAPLKALHAGLTRELGTVATREEKHALVGAILGHPITSTKELTRDEGYRVLDYMQRFSTGEARWKVDLATGRVTVEDTTAEPPDDADG